jgi:hypothetical protein
MDYRDNLPIARLVYFYSGVDSVMAIGGLPRCFGMQVGTLMTNELNAYGGVRV